MEWKRYHRSKIAWRYANRFLEQDSPMNEFYEVMHEELREKGQDEESIAEIVKLFESAVRQAAILGRPDKEEEK